MDASMVLWTKWHEQVKQVLVGVHGHQKKTLALCVLGIILSQSAVREPDGRRDSAAWDQRGEDAEHRTPVCAFRRQ